MGELTWRTAGESHGASLVALLEGVPAGLVLDLERLQLGMARRWAGYGRGPRAALEKDRVTVPAGLKGGATIGSPLVLQIPNADASLEELPQLSAARPGHADLVGCLRGGHRDIRAILERASARETAARVAMGEVARQMLGRFGIGVGAQVTAIGGLEAASSDLPCHEWGAATAESAFLALDPETEASWVEKIEQAKKDGDSLGGRFQVAAWGLPPGLGGYAQAADRLDGRLLGALGTIPGVKAVAIGLGRQAADRMGSQVHDPLEPDPDGWFGVGRPSNRAGGIEGGMTTGAPILLEAAMKPIPTMRSGISSIELSSGRSARSTYERSDVCAVPAAAVVAQGVLLLELARAFLERFGGVTMGETASRYEQFCRSGPLPEMPASAPDAEERDSPRPSA